jgi:hypothetical protein
MDGKISIKFRDSKKAKTLIEYLFEPYLQNAIDFDKIFHTTRDETYRKSAIENCNRAIQLLKIYNLLVPELAKQAKAILYREINKSIKSEEDKKLEKLINKLTKSVPFESVEKWKNHIINCKETTNECEQYTKLLENYNQQIYKNASKFLKEAYELLIPIIAQELRSVKIYYKSNNL